MPKLLDWLLRVRELLYLSYFTSLYNWQSGYEYSTIKKKDIQPPSNYSGQKLKLWNEIGLVGAWGVYNIFDYFALTEASMQYSNNDSPRERLQ